MAMCSIFITLDWLSYNWTYILRLKVTKAYNNQETMALKHAMYDKITTALKMNRERVKRTHAF